MEEFENREQKDEVFSRAIRAGKRTYFFDVKATKFDEYYITITESKRRFDNNLNKFTYEKHKLFLYKEDFEKFIEGLTETIRFCNDGNNPEGVELQEVGEPSKTSEIEDFDFDDK